MSIFHFLPQLISLLIRDLFFFNSGPEHIAIQSNSGAATPKQEGHLQISGFMVSGLITKMEATHPTAIPTALSTEPR